MSWFDEILSHTSTKSVMVTREQALPGRPDPIPRSRRHYVNGHPPLTPAVPGRSADRRRRHGLLLGVPRRNSGNSTVCTRPPPVTPVATPPNPTYEEVCSGRTGHTEVVLVVFDPEVIGYAQILQQFWENHDPTQGMRQGNDQGTQYRSAIYTFDESQIEIAEATAEAFGKRLATAGYGAVTTEIAPLTQFYYAEDYHQQYLAKNPNGYCPVHATGVSCPVGLGL